jgi:hypothetical protein
MRKIIIILILLTSFTVFAQSGTTIKSDDLLKLRNLQYEQAKIILRMQDLKSEFDRLNTEQIKKKDDIDKWIKDQAKEQNIDLTTHQFDLDQLKFVEIKKNE